MRPGWTCARDGRWKMPEFYHWSGDKFQRVQMLLDALGLETGSLQIKCPATEIAECGSEMDGKRPCRVISMLCPLLFIL